MNFHWCPEIYGRCSTREKKVVKHTRGIRGKFINTRKTCPDSWTFWTAGQSLITQLISFKKRAKVFYFIWQFPRRAAAVAAVAIAPGAFRLSTGGTGPSFFIFENANGKFFIDNRSSFDLLTVYWLLFVPLLQENLYRFWVFKAFFRPRVRGVRWIFFSGVIVKRAFIPLIFISVLLRALLYNRIKWFTHLRTSILKCDFFLMSFKNNSANWFLYIFPEYSSVF